MRIAIRADASSQIGMGHFMRCLTLADAARRRDARIRFVSRHLPAHLRDMLRVGGHEFAPLESAPIEEPADEGTHSHWLGASQAADAHLTTRALSDGTWDWLIVDHYALDARWEQDMRPSGKRIFVIDDMADRAHACHMLLDQNFYADMDTRYTDRVPASCELLLGPHYALLRPEFSRLRAGTGVRDGNIRRILVLLGGVDAENHTEKVVRAIAALPASFEVDVVIGMQHPAGAGIAVLCERHGYHCHVQSNNVAELMAEADLAIGASGSTSWERCCLGLPTICMTHAANQVPIADGLAGAGAIVNLGDGETLTSERIGESIMLLAGRPDLVLSLSAASRSLVDGLGADRVCDRLYAAQ